MEAGKFVPDASHIYLSNGFQAGKVYQVIYSTSTAPIVGMGLLATRDLTSFLRYAEAGNPCDGAVRRAYAFGRSQSGRFLRVYLYHGLNRDEQDRTVFDGLIPLVAGGPARGVQLPFRSAIAPFRPQRQQSVPIHRRGANRPRDRQDRRPVVAYRGPGTVAQDILYQHLRRILGRPRCVDPLRRGRRS